MAIGMCHDIEVYFSDVVGTKMELKSRRETERNIPRHIDAPLSSGNGARTVLQLLRVERNVLGFPL